MGTYVMTGYCMPAATEERRLRNQRRSLCSAPSDYAYLSEVMNDLSPSMPNGATLKVFDSIDLCGGSTTSFSDEMYFQDPIHLNSKGYCKVFTPDAVQNALKCGASEPIDCDSFNTEIYGLGKEYTHKYVDGKAFHRGLDSFLAFQIILYCCCTRC